MPGPPSTLKKALVSEGFEIYRTAPNLISLADRVRDNLLMDSGVAVVEGENMAIRVVFRAQASNFPGEAADGLFARARALSATLIGRGYGETGTDTVAISDPGDRSRTIDTWYEVTYSLPGVPQAKLYDELRFVLGVAKNAERT
ncbi:MAG TPA: hypothetical protein VGQ57_14670 [Polyangiaceae bacterium]|jgi:hypothetical protein|nr:hypothetical protein [Polyangiaceae bacterium]